MPYEKPQIVKEEEKLPLFEKLLKNFAEKIQQEPDLKFLKDFYKEFPQSNIYLVGGMVRDAAMGVKKMAKDFDFVVNRIELDDLINFLQSKGTVDLVGRNFGVLKFAPKDSELDEAIDIALPRTEFSVGQGGGYKDFEVQADPNLNIEKDLSRRDLTINAMALDLKNKKSNDPFDGLNDLANKEIKAVLKPEDRFKEDYSRMLRAIRFATRFDFKIEKNTWQAIKNLAPNINKTRKINGKTERVVPTETIAKEFIKSLSANPEKTLELYDKAGFLKELIPELLELKGCEQSKNHHSEGDTWEHTMLCLKNLNSAEFKTEFKKPAPPEVIIALLLHDIAKPQTKSINQKTGQIQNIGHEKEGAEIAKDISKRLNLPSYNGIINTEKLVWLIKNHMVSKADKPASMKATKLEKLFFKDPKLGEKLLMVCFADDISCLTPQGPNIEGYNILKSRLAEIKKLNQDKKEIIKPLLDGHEIMKKFNLKPGKQIGSLLNIVREAQLTGQIKSKEEALELIKQNI